MELPPNLRDGVARDSFTDALNSGDLELAVFQSQAKTLKQVVMVTMQFEAFHSIRPRQVATAVSECNVEHWDDIDDVSLKRIGQLEDELCTLRVSKNSNDTF